MRSFDWNDVFRLPDAALAGDRRIPKTVLTRQALLTKTEQKVLDRISALTHFATVQKSTTRIPPAIDEEHDIQSILFLRCEMAKGAAYAEVARLIHKCFPNPTVILFGSNEETCISVATTRKSLAEQGATVIDAIESTGVFDANDAAYAPFLDALAFEHLPQTDLLAYLNALSMAAFLSKAIKPLGFFPRFTSANSNRAIALIKSYDELQQELDALKAQRRDRSLSINETSKIRIQMRNKDKQRTHVLDELRGLCDV